MTGNSATQDNALPNGKPNGKTDRKSSYDAPDRLGGREALEELKIITTREWRFVEIDVAKEVCFIPRIPGSDGRRRDCMANKDVGVHGSSREGRRPDVSLYDR